MRSGREGTSLFTGIGNVTPAPDKLIVVAGHRRLRWALREAVSRVALRTDAVEVESIAELERTMSEAPGAALIVLDLSALDARGLSALMDLRARYPSVAIAIISAADIASVLLSMTEAFVAFLHQLDDVFRRQSLSRCAFVSAAAYARFHAGMTPSAVVAVTAPAISKRRAMLRTPNEPA